MTKTWTANSLPRGTGIPEVGIILINYVKTNLTSNSMLCQSELAVENCLVFLTIIASPTSGQYFFMRESARRYKISNKIDIILPARYIRVQKKM